MLGVRFGSLNRQRSRRSSVLQRIPPDAELDGRCCGERAISVTPEADPHGLTHLPKALPPIPEAEVDPLPRQGPAFRIEDPSGHDRSLAQIDVPQVLGLARLEPAPPSLSGNEPILVNVQRELVRRQWHEPKLKTAVLAGDLAPGCPPLHVTVLDDVILEAFDVSYPAMQASS